jgi:hypothetical protein
VLRLNLSGSESREQIYRAIFLALSHNDKLIAEFSHFSVGVVERLFEAVRIEHRRLHPAAVDWVPHRACRGARQSLSARRHLQRRGSLGGAQ